MIVIIDDVAAAMFMSVVNSFKGSSVGGGRRTFFSETRLCGYSALEEVDGGESRQGKRPKKPSRSKSKRRRFPSSGNRTAGLDNLRASD